MIAYISTSKGKYTITGLPAGRYKIGHTFLPACTHLCEFDLGPGQHREIDVDGDQWQIAIGSLLLHVVDGDGRVLSHAQVWLENNEGVIGPYFDEGDTLAFAAPAGRYTLTIQCDRYVPHAEPVILEPWQIGTPNDNRKVVRLVSSE